MIFALLDRWSAQRWPIALRSAIAIGVPVAAGWATGHQAAGFMGSIGAFTALYASHRPYRNRALVLAIVAVCFAAVVGIGLETQRIPIVALPAVVLIAALATFMCNALGLGPPGAYMFALACAAGTAMPISGLSVGQIVLLVFSGGAFSWLLHMSGALINPRAPERTAVAGAARVVAQFAESATPEARLVARHAAALGLNDAWTTLVARQPLVASTPQSILRLRSLNRELHLLFVAQLSTTGESNEARSAGDRARAIGAAATRRDIDVPVRAHGSLPLGHAGPQQALLGSLRSWSPPLVTTLRVSIAAVGAAAIGAAFGIERAYWVVAAAVLVLHQGLDWARTLNRAGERIAGTLVGLGLAAAVFALHPSGLLLVLTLMLLQFIIESIVIRSYAVAVVFITAIALIIGSGGTAIADPADLLRSRAIDTVLGCLIGLGVHAATARWISTAPVRHGIARVLNQLRAALDDIGAGTVTTASAMRARRDLQLDLIALLTAYETTAGGIVRGKSGAEDIWPSVAATLRAGYDVLSAFWTLEEAGAERAAELGPALLPRLESDIVALITASLTE